MTLPAARLFLLNAFVQGVFMSLVFTVSMIYMVDMAQLNPLQLVLVGTALEVAAFAFEVPTGVVADLYSRKLSIIIGFVMMGFGFVLGGLVPTFAAIAIGTFIWGVGWTFMSGAREAWLADEVGSEAAAPLFLAGARLGHYGTFVGIGVAVLIGSIQINYPYVLGGIGLAAWGLMLIVLMPETGFQRRDFSEWGRWQSFKSTLAGGVVAVRRSRVLLVLMAVAVITGAWSEGYDRLAVAHLLRTFEFPLLLGFQPVVWFGAMAALGSLLSIGAVAFTENRLDLTRGDLVGRVLSTLTLAVTIAAFCFALAGHLAVALVAYIAIGPIRAVTYPLITAWLNQQLSSDVRATVISLHGQADALGQMAGGPGVGWLGKAIGLPVALALSSTLLTPAIALYRMSGQPEERGT